VGCGSHTWEAMGMSILMFCCSIAAALALLLEKKDKSYVCPSNVLFVDFGLFCCQCFVHFIKEKVFKYLLFPKN
jgi:hypothetical protein